jgi:Ni/Fe-hydrogenase subunit HybB-like protein
MPSPEMTRDEIIAAGSCRPVQPRLLLLFAFMAVMGAAVFVNGISGPHSQRIWQVYLINFVFWTGLAAGCVLFSAILSITHAHWGRSIKRLAKPLAFFCRWPLFCSRSFIPGGKKFSPGL